MATLSPPKPGPRAPQPPPAVSAVEMGARQREISVSEFFTKNRHLLGFDNPRKALLTCVKEAVDNALDACEEAGILPDVVVKVEPVGEGEAPAPAASQATRFRITITDNGPGIVRQQVPPIFAKLLYGSKFHRLRMSRGQQGIGISAAGMYGQLTTGKPVQIISRTSPRTPAHYFEVQIDTKKNEPLIIEKKQIEWDSPRGTQVALEVEGRYQKGRASVDEYVEQTIIANPHVKLTYLAPGRRDEGVPADVPAAAAVAAGDQAAPLRHRAGDAAEDAPGHPEPFARRVPGQRLQPGVAAPGRGHQQGRGAVAGRPPARRARAGDRGALQGHPGDQDHGAADQLPVAHRGEGDPGRPLPADQGRLLHRGEPAAGRVSRQPLRHRGGAGLRARAGAGRRSGEEDGPPRRRGDRTITTTSSPASCATPTGCRCCTSSRPA